MSELPKGWAITSLGDIAIDIQGGGTPSKNVAENFSGEIPFMTVKDMKTYRPTDTQDKITEKALHSCSSKLIPAGTPIVCTRMGLGKIVVVDFSTAINQDLKAVFLEKRLIAVKYFEYWYRSIFEKINSMGTGTTVKGITLKQLQELQIPIPPAGEQTRIAQKLDELLTQVDTLKARIDAIPALLKRFRQSVLAAAVSGRLTEEWRASSVPEASSEYQSVDVLEPWSHTIEAPVSWQLHIFEEVIKLVGGSQPPKSEFAYELKPGFVRLIQIRDYKSDSHKVFINQESTKKFCDKHDVMIGRYGPPIFQILRGLEGAYNVALMKAVPLEGLDNEYMYWYLQNYKLLNFVEAGSDRTAGQSGVNKAFLEKYPLFMPPLDEQAEIVRRVEQLFAFADQLEAKVATTQARIDRLTQSILAKAFRGELVPQDPNDEPASLLLERIQAQRAAAPKAKRGRKATV